MKIIITLIAFTLIISSCSKSDDSFIKEVPESFDIKIEIDGIFSVPRIHIGINSLVIKEWRHEDLPFTAEYTYITKGNEINNTACKCITISAWAYLSKINEMQTFKLYVDGNLVDSTSVTASARPDGTINPTRIEFVY